MSAVSKDPSIDELASARAADQPVLREVSGERHVGALDGVRGLAILLVLLQHTSGSVMSEFHWSGPLISLCRVGWTGVDMFFVLSGFLITGILYDAKGKPHYLKNFYARRALRIFPLYYAALVVTLLLRAAWPEAGFYWTESQGWLWIYATNVIIATKGFDSFGILEHFWSLAVEEHFYLVWPFLVLWLDRRKLMWVAAFTWVFSLALRGFLVWADNVPAAYTFTPARVDSLATGAFIALAARGAGIESLKKVAWFLGPACIAGFAAIVVALDSASYHRPLITTLGLTLLAGGYGSLLVLAQTFRPAERVFNLGFLRFLGKYSYGIYVWHPLFFIIAMHSDLARRTRGGTDLPWALASLALAFGATSIVVALSWYLLESRFLKLKKYFH